MKKKIVIKGLIPKNLEAQLINVGEALLPLEEDLVEKIVYEDHCYNRGRQGKFPAYVVFFAHSDERYIVRETEISTVVVEAQNIEDEQAIPELPEQPVIAESPEVSV